MAELNLEQQKAVAIAQARRKRASAQPSPDALSRAAAADQIAEDRMTLSGIPKAGQFAIAQTTGLPFVGSYVDEALDAINPGQGERLRRVTDAMERENPGLTTAGNIAGGVLGSLPIVGPAAGAIARVPNILARSGLAAGAGLAAGGTEGVISGFGEGETPQGRVDSALEGGKWGAVFGGAVGALAPGAAKGIESLVTRLRKSDIRVISSILGIGFPAARVIKRAFEMDDPQAVKAALDRVGSDAMLADAGDAAGALLDASTATGGDALAVPRARIDARSSQQQDVLASTFDDILGTPKGIRTAARDVSRFTAPTRKRAYDAAYNQPVDYGTGAWGEQVLGVLDRVPPADMQKAVDTANKLMRMKDKSYRQILLRVGDDGEVAFEEMPTMMHLDYIKRGLNDLAKQNTDDFGRLRDVGTGYNQIAGELRDLLRDNNPMYARALRVGGDKIAMDESLDLGSRLFNPSTTLEDVRETVTSVDARNAVAVGVRNQLERIMGDAKATLTDGNVNAREAIVAVKALSSRNNRAKLVAAVGRNKADKLLEKVDEAAAALELRATIALNSKTAVRQAIQDEARQVGLPSSLREIAGSAGNPFNAMEKMTQALLNVDSAADNKQMFAQISDALTRVRGEEARKALDAIQGAMRGQPIAEERAKAVARYLTETPGLLIYQSGTQLSTTP